MIVGECRIALPAQALVPVITQKAWPHIDAKSKLGRPKYLPAIHCRLEKEIRCGR